MMFAEFTNLGCGICGIMSLGFANSVLFLKFATCDLHFDNIFINFGQLSWNFWCLHFQISNGFKNLGIYEKSSILDFETNCIFLKLYFFRFYKKMWFLWYIWKKLQGKKWKNSKMDNNIVVPRCSTIYEWLYKYSPHRLG